MSNLIRDGYRQEGYVGTGRFEPGRWIHTPGTPGSWVESYEGAEGAVKGNQISEGQQEVPPFWRSATPDEVADGLTDDGVNARYTPAAPDVETRPLTEDEIENGHDGVFSHDVRVMDGETPLYYKEPVAPVPPGEPVIAPGSGPIVPDTADEDSVAPTGEYVPCPLGTLDTTSREYGISWITITITGTPQDNTSHGDNLSFRVDNPAGVTGNVSVRWFRGANDNNPVSGSVSLDGSATQNFSGVDVGVTGNMHNGSGGVVVPDIPLLQVPVYEWTITTPGSPGSEGSPGIPLVVRHYTFTTPNDGTWEILDPGAAGIPASYEWVRYIPGTPGSSRYIRGAEIMEPNMVPNYVEIEGEEEYVEIEGYEVPLAAFDDYEYIDIEDFEVPLADFEQLSSSTYEEYIEIEDFDPPLAAMPQTGLSGVTALLTSGMLLSAFLSAFVANSIRKIRGGEK